MSLFQDVAAAARSLSILGPDAKGDPPESTCCGCLAAFGGEAPCGSASFSRIRPATAIAWDERGFPHAEGRNHRLCFERLTTIAPMGRPPLVARRVMTAWVAHARSVRSCLA